MADEPDLPVQKPEVVDQHGVPILYADWIVTGGTNAQVLNLTLGAIDYALRTSTEVPPRIVISAQLRMPLTTAENLYKFLGDLLYGERKPTPTPPKNTMN